MISKICLGTVQFGQDYGIANKRGRVPKDEAFQIFDYARSVGIQYLDTALAYGESEIIIGEYLRKNPDSFKIISKLPSLERFSVGEVEDSIGRSFQRIGIKQLDGYLFHKSTDALVSEDIWNSLMDLKKNGQVKKIGFSLYCPDELIALFDKNIDFDIVQLPYSVFDRRFQEYFDDLKNRGIEIQARSVFLQGLPFLDLDDFPAGLQEIKPRLEKLQQISENQNISIEALCLNFVLCSAYIDKVLIGVDSLTQLKSNISGINLSEQMRSIDDKLKEIKIEQEELLLPYLWKIQN